MGSIYKHVDQLLKSGRLYSACAFLSMHFARHNAHRLVEETQALQADNDRLLSYFAQGIDDPHRNEVRDQLMDRAWELVDKLYLMERPGNEEPLKSTIAELLQSLLLSPNDDLLLGETFDAIANSHVLEKTDRKALHQAILDEQLPEYVRGTLLGAMMLLLLQWFDAKLVENLYIYTLDDQPVQLRAQAWVTLAFVALIHNHRIAHLPRLREQYQLLAESEPELLFQLQISMLQCREAFSFDNKINELVSNATDDEEEFPSQERIDEFFKLIKDGVDMSISTFSQLKKMPFFSAPKNRHHWFEPFSLEQPHVRQILEKTPEAKTWTLLLMQSVAQCETDKYSAFLSMNAVNSGLMIKISQKLESKGFNFDNIAPLSLAAVVRNHLHDIFRYCTMHPSAKELRFKVFDRDLNLCNNPWFKAAFCEIESSRKVADFLFSKRRWDEAACAYYELLQRQETEETLQRLIHADRMADYMDRKTTVVTVPSIDSLEMLTRCNHRFPGNKWTIKHLADQYESRGKYDSEVLLLQEALQQYPEDLGLLSRMGHALTMSGKPAEALSYLYKADMLKEGQLRVHREMALAFLESHDNANAERYIRKVLSRPTPTDSDWRLAGDIAMQVGNIPLALERLQQYEGGYLYMLDDREELADIKRRGIDLTLAALLNETLEKSGQGSQENEAEERPQS